MTYYEAFISVVVHWVMDVLWLLRTRFFFIIILIHFGSYDNNNEIIMIIIISDYDNNNEIIMIIIISDYDNNLTNKVSRSELFLHLFNPLNTFPLEELVKVLC